MSKFITRALIIILLTYSLIVTFMLIQGISPKKIFQSYFFKVPKDEIINVAAEYKFISEFFENYFLIIKDTDSKRKYHYLSNKTHNTVSHNFLLEFKNTLDLYVKNSAVREYELIKVIRNRKTNEYNTFVHMRSKFPKEDQKEFLMQIDLKLKKDHEGVIRLSDWKEKILTTRPKELLLKNISLSEDVTTELKLPCEFTSVTPIKNHQAVKMSWDSKNRKIKFLANSKLEDNSQFRVQCKDRFFVLNLVNDDDFQTIFYAFDIKDGVLIKKQLTEREKLIKTLESHMGVKVQN